jgi:thiol-disulfide isomerase/thioredoxin
MFKAGTRFVVAMSGAAVPSGRVRFGWRFRLLVVLAVAITAFAVLGIVQTLHYSSAKTGVSQDQLGFFKPKSATPVAFSLPQLTAASKASETTLSELVGKPVVLNLWASYCTVCKSETPALTAVARSIGDRVTFVGIDSADERGPALAFEHKYPTVYPQLFDPGAIVADGYGVPGLPVTVFISAAGKVVGENVGALTVASLRHDLSTLFGQ